MRRHYPRRSQARTSPRTRVFALALAFDLASWQPFISPRARARASPRTGFTFALALGCAFALALAFDLARWQPFTSPRARARTSPRTRFCKGKTLSKGMLLLMLLVWSLPPGLMNGCQISAPACGRRNLTACTPQGKASCLVPLTCNYSVAVA